MSAPGDVHDQFDKGAVVHIGRNMFPRLPVGSKSQMPSKGWIHKGHGPLRIGHHQSVGQGIDDRVDTAFLRSQIGKGSLAFFGKLFSFPGESDFFPCPVHHNPQLVRLKGFGNKIIGSLLHGFDGGFDRCKTGDDDDQNFGVHGSDVSQHLHAVHAGHFQVQKHDADRFPGKDREPFITPAGLGNTTSHAGQDSLRSVPNTLFIVNDQHMRGLRAIPHGCLL